MDTGIDPAHPAVARVAGGVRISLDGQGRPLFDDDFIDATGHGTACAGILSQGIRARIELYAVRIIDGERGSSARLLEEAIAWSAAHGARVINVSLGAQVWGEEAEERLRAACREAVGRGCVIVAAGGPDGTRPLPAALDEVITVGSASCPGDTIYVARGGHLDFLARGDLQRVAWTGGSSVLARGTSLAAAHVSRAVCRLLARDPSLDDAAVRRLLREGAVQGDDAFRQRWEAELDGFYRRRTPERTRWIGRAALYPFNKEMHALVRFRDLVPFTLHAVADPPGKRLCGRDAGEVLGCGTAGLPILPSVDRALEGADTLILGHTEALEDVTSRRYLPRLLERAISLGKNVVSFSRVLPGEHGELLARAEQQGLHVADPTVTRDEVDRLLAAAGANPADPALATRGVADGARLHQHRRAALRSALHPPVHECPVLGVFGTSKAQGKFSLQLSLRRALGKLGYRVAHLATEPTGMLLGASATLPMGYERGEDFRIEIWSYLARLLAVEVVNRERPDLLLTGGQSSIASFSPELHRLGFSSLDTMAFGIAVQPDACVLVCNLFDPPAHVRRCVAVIEAVLHSRVIALAVNDQSWEVREFHGIQRRSLVRLPESVFREAVRERERELGIPAAGVLGEGDPDRLAGLVVDFFASSPAAAEAAAVEDL